MGSGTSIIQLLLNKAYRKETLAAKNKIETNAIGKYLLVQEIPQTSLGTEMQKQMYSVLILIFTMFNTCYCSSEATQIRSYDLQDRPSVASGNPLKGISKFNFFTGFPAPNPKTANKISALIETELKQFGQVQRPEMLVKTDQGDVID